MKGYLTERERRRNKQALEVCPVDRPDDFDDYTKEEQDSFHEVYALSLDCLKLFDAIPDSELYDIAKYIATRITRYKSLMAKEDANELRKVG